jgi:hypothetical protein
LIRIFQEFLKRSNVVKGMKPGLPRRHGGSENCTAANRESSLAQRTQSTRRKDYAVL